MSNKLVVSDYDFDAIKVNLKSFLQGQTAFQDYDFEGSSLNILLDILSYNTHYLATWQICQQMNYILIVQT